MTLPQMLRERARDSTAVAGLIRVIDIVLAPILFVGLVVARVIRVLGIQRAPVARRVVNATGVLPVHDHYYQPLVRPEQVVATRGQRTLPGIDLRWEAQAGLLRRLGDHRSEFELLLLNGNFDPDNGFYGRTDAAVLHGMLRHLQPSTVVEVGSGHSTKVAVAALALNARRGRRAEHLCIEPFENRWLESMDVDVIRTRVEEVPFEMFDSLTEGDVLFIDSSHVLRPGGDVLHLFLSVLPRLAPGVVVHVHDVFTPADYPADWLVRLRRLWNEQYLLEALLSGGARFEVDLAVNAMWRRDPDSLRALGAEGEGAAFWIRRTSSS